MRIIVLGFMLLIAACAEDPPPDDGTFRVAVKQDVRMGVEENGPPHLVLPVVVVRDAPKRGFDTAKDNRHIRVSLFTTL